MASRLPDNPSLDKLKVQARTLQRRVRAADPEALAAVERWHPSPTVALAAASSSPLHAAQLTVARGYGFSGWPALVGYLAEVAALGTDPLAIDEAGLSRADRFCVLACLRYDGEDAPPRRAAAAALLAEQPDLVDDHLWAAAAAADLAAVRRHLAADPASVTRRGGPDRWPALCALTYSRVLPDGADPLGVAAALLDAGADVDSGFLWRGMATPFTALTGVFGEGEMGPIRQVRHSRSLELATLLLERGADPNDAQTLYNRMFSPGTDHLELLFDYGLGRTPSVWQRRLGEATESIPEMLQRQVDWAATHGMADRLAVLAANGVDVSGVTCVAEFDESDPRWPNLLVEGRTPLHDAASADDVAEVRRLLAAGADPTITDLRFGSTPLGWAEWGYAERAAEVLDLQLRTLLTDNT